MTKSKISQIFFKSEFIIKSSKIGSKGGISIINFRGVENEINLKSDISLKTFIPVFSRGAK